MLRKNFPRRKESRRLEAQARQARFDAIVEKHKKEKK